MCEEGGMVSKGSGFFFSPCISSHHWILDVQTRGVRSRRSNDTIYVPLPMGNHPTATELVNCHSLLYNRSNLNSISHSIQGPEELVGLKSHPVHYSV